MLNNETKKRILCEKHYKCTLCLMCVYQGQAYMGLNILLGRTDKDNDHHGFFVNCPALKRNYDYQCIYNITTRIEQLSVFIS